MISAMKYLKFDLRIMKEKNQYIYLTLIPILIWLMLNYIEFGLTSLMLFMIVYVSVPFGNEKVEGLEDIYSLLPEKSSSIVLARFIYFNIMMIITMFICIGTGFYYFNMNVYGMTIMGEIIIIANFFVILNFFLYYLTYRAQIEKMNGTRTTVISIITLLVFVIIVLIPIEMKMISTLCGNELNYIVNFIANNKKLFISIEILSIEILGCISYLASCRICNRKGDFKKNEGCY